MSSGLSIGDLVGTISLEDRFSQSFELLGASTKRSIEDIGSSMTMASTIGSFFGNTLSNLALGAVSFGKSLVTNSLMAGARLEQLGGVTRFLGERAGYTSQYIDELATKIEKSGITGVQSRDAITQLIGAHIDLSKATQLSAVAQNMATISGESSSETYGKIIRAITTLQPDLLRTAGFTVSLNQVMNEYKETTGKSADALTGQQKQQLILNAVLKEGAEKAGLYGLSMEYAGKQAGSAERAWAQVSEQIGTALLPITTTAIKAWYALGTSVRDAVAGSQASVKDAAQAIAGSLQGLISLTGRVAEASIQAGQSIIGAYDALPPFFRRLSENVALAAVAFWAVNAAATALAGTQVAVWASVLIWPLTILTAQMSAFGIATGVSTTLVFLWEKALITAGAAARATWATIVANPLIAATAAVGALALAFVSLKQATADAALAAETAGAKQDVINRAIKNGAPLNVTYEAAIKLNAEAFRRLSGGALSVSDSLEALHGNSGQTITQIRELEKSVIAASNAFKEEDQLSTPVMQRVVQGLKSAGMAAADLPPALSAIIRAMDQMTKVDPGAAMAARLLALQKESTEQLTSAQREYINVAHKAGDTEKEIAAATGASERAIHLYVKAVTESVAPTSASIKSTAKLWDGYFDLVEKRMGNFEDDQLRALDRWYNDEVTTLNESKKNNANYTNQIAALQANLWEKKAAVSETFFIEKARKDMALLSSAIEESFKAGLPTRDITNGILKISDSAQVANKAIVEAMNARRPGVMTDATRKLVEQMKDLGIAASRIAEIFGLQESQVLTTMEKIHSQLDAWAATLTQLAQVSGGTFGGRIKEIAEVAVAWNAASKAADAYGEAAKKGSKAGMALALVQGAVAMEAATGSGSRGKRVIGGAMTGMEMGMAVAGPWGAVVGAGVGALVGWIRGADAVEKAVNKTRQTMVDAAGGLDALNRRAVAAGGNLNAILDARTPEAYAAAMDDLNKRFQTMEDIRSAGFSSSDDLQALADTAKRVYERMLESGKYTAEQLEKAFRDSAAAQARALGDPLQAMADAAGAAGYKTQEELQKAAREAQRLAVWMRDSGRYTAEAVEDAFAKATDAADRAFGKNTARMKELKTEMEGLQKSVEAEAWEPDMGSIERAQRERIDAIKKEMDEAQRNANATANSVADTVSGAASGAVAGALDGLVGGFSEAFTRAGGGIEGTMAGTADVVGGKFKETADVISSHMADASWQMRDGMIGAANDAADGIIERFSKIRIRIPIEFDAPELPAKRMAAGGAGTVYGPTLFLAGEAGPEQFAFSGAGKSFRAAEGASGGDIVIMVDGREIARAAVPHIPAELRRRGAV